jgi:cell division protein FtsB
VEKVTHSADRTAQNLFFWALTVAGLALLFLVTALPVLRQRRTMEVMVEQMTGRNVELYDRLDRLEKERLALLSDPFYVEKLARRDLRMCRPGEMQLSVTPAGYERHMQTAERHVTAAEPVGLSRLYGALGALADDKLLRRMALVLGGATIVAGVLLFGRSAGSRPG